MVLEKARELGKAISLSDEYTQLLKAQHAMEQNFAAFSMMELYQKKQEELADLLSGESPDTEEIKDLSEQIDELQEKLFSNETFADYLKAQREFQTLILNVNKELSGFIHIGGISKQEGCGGGCGGGCSSCHMN